MIEESKRFWQEVGQGALEQLQSTKDKQELDAWHRKWLGRKGFFSLVFKALWGKN